MLTKCLLTDAKSTMLGSLQIKSLMLGQKLILDTFAGRLRECAEVIWASGATLRSGFHLVACSELQPLPRGVRAFLRAPYQVRSVPVPTKRRRFTLLPLKRPRTLLSIYSSLTGWSSSGFCSSFTSLLVSRKCLRSTLIPVTSPLSAF